MFLWIGGRALSEFASRVLQGAKRHPASLRQQAQVRIAVERSLVAELA
jgi:hypothetical protein